MGNNKVNISNKYVQEEIDEGIQTLDGVLNGDVITIVAPMAYGMNDLPSRTRET